MSNITEFILSEDYLATTIYKIRNQKVILDRDIARLYGIPTKALKQAVRRNPDRFPLDFMFELSEAEFENWRSQFVTSNFTGDKMGLRYASRYFFKGNSNRKALKIAGCVTVAWSSWGN